MRVFMTYTALPVLAAALLLFGGCGDDNDDGNGHTTKHSYEITVTNLTAGQPFSPVGIVLHTEGYHAFAVGEAASEGLEMMAEGGDVTTLLEDADGMDSVTATASGSGIILPGASETVTVNSLKETRLSLVSMLVNTNDAFTGLDGGDISELASGESMTFYLNTYDAGTELNSETAATVPGPAGNGEGLNSARDDNDMVTLHPGVITSDDGLDSSTLTAIHKWDNPTAMVTITRE